MFFPFLKIILYIAEGGFVCQRGDGSRPERLSRPENHFRVLVGLGLVFPGKIQVNIRLLVSFKPKKSLKGNVKSILVQCLPADRAGSVRHVRTRFSGICFYIFFLKIHIMAFTTVIMGTQRIDLRDACHGGHKRTSHASAGSHQVTVLHGFPHQLLGDNVHHRKTICNDGMQLLFQPGLHDFRQIGPINFMCLIIADLGQRLVTVFNDRGAFIRTYRSYVFHHIRNHIGVFHHDLICFVTSQIVKLLQHFFRGVQKQRGLVIRILEPSSRHDNPSINLVLRIQKMHVAGSHHRLPELLSQFHNTAVDILNILHGADTAHPVRGNHKFIVSQRLKFQIIVKIHNPCNLHFTLLIQQRPVQLPCLTGAAQNQPVPVLHNQALGNSGMSSRIIGQMGLRHQPVKIDPSQVVFRQNDGMVGGKLFDQIHAGRPQFVQLRQVVNPPAFQHLNQLQENPCGAFRIIHCPVMIFQGNIQRLGHGIQSMFRLVGKEHPGNAHRVNVSALRTFCRRTPGLPGTGNGKFLSSGIFLDETHVKSRVMGHKDTAPAKLQEFRQHFFYLRGVLHHIIPDSGEFFYLKRDRHPRIDKCRITVRDLPSADLHRPDFYNAVIHRGKTRGLNVKDHKILIQGLPPVPGDNFLQVVHQVGFHPVNDFEKFLLVRRIFPFFLAFRFFRLPQILPHMIGIGKTLHHTVVCYGDGPVSPFVGAFHNILCLAHPVKIAHFGVAVQLHALVERPVHPHRGEILNFPDAGEGAYGQLMVKFIQRGNPFEFYERSRLQTVQQFLHKFIFGKKLYRYGIRKIRHVKNDYGSLISDGTAVCL